MIRHRMPARCAAGYNLELYPQCHFTYTRIRINSYIRSKPERIITQHAGVGLPSTVMVSIAIQRYTRARSINHVVVEYHDLASSEPSVSGC